MKKFRLSIFITIIAVINSYAQKFSAGDIVTLTNSVQAESSELFFTQVEHPEKEMSFLEDGVKFKVLEISESSVKLIAIPFKKVTDTQKEKLNAKNERIKGEYYNNKVYSITLKNFMAFAQKVEEIDRIGIGIVTLPFKARPQDDISFDTEINLSTAVNFYIGKFKGATFNLQFGAGIGSVELNSNNALGIDDSEAQDIATLTMFTGAMLQYKKVQVGLYVGVDHINNQENYQWKSNGNLWLGFGIGFDVFSISVSTPKNKQSN